MCLGCGIGLCPGRWELCSQEPGSSAPSCSVPILSDLGTEVWAGPRVLQQLQLDFG